MMLVMSLKNFKPKNDVSTSQKILQCNNVQELIMHNVIFRAHLPPHNSRTWKSKWWNERYTNALQLQNKKLEKNPLLFIEFKRIMWIIYRQRLWATFVKWVHMHSRSIPSLSPPLGTQSWTFFIHFPSRHMHGGYAKKGCQVMYAVWCDFIAWILNYRKFKCKSIENYLVWLQKYFWLILNI